MISFVCADTEDNTPELVASGKSLFGKKLTQIAAIGLNGKRFYSRGKECCPKKFLTWLQSQVSEKQWLRVYFHNLQYDLGAFFADSLDELDQLLVGGRLIRARWRNIEFRDSLNIWPMSLKDVGDSVGLKKMETKIHSKKYVFRDVAIVRKAMNLAYELAQEHGVESTRFPSTLGGLCVKIWHGMGGENFQNCWKLAKQAYYGGRVELFSRGGSGNIAYTDINSLYPSVMCQPFPDSWEEMETFTKGWGVARVRIEIPKCFIAPLPVRREDGMIFYPHGIIDGDDSEMSNGQRNGVWTFHEIRNAVQHGAKVSKVYEAYGSRTASFHYRNFVQKFYAMRKNEKDKGMRTFFKLLMNNLYGQLCMSGLVTRTLSLEKNLARDPLTMQPVVRNGEYLLDIPAERHPYPFGSKVMADCLMPLPEHVNYLHGAYVTSYARLVLQRFLRIIPPKDLVYCDTDSLMFFQNPNKRMPFLIDDELGSMKLEGFASRVVIESPKTYFLQMDKAIYKAKGVPARKDETDKQGRTLAQRFIEEGRAEFLQPYKMRESIIFYDRMKAHVRESKQETENEALKTDAEADKIRKLGIWRKIEKVKRTNYDKKLEVKGRFFPKKYCK